MSQFAGENFLAGEPDGDTITDRHIRALAALSVTAAIALAAQATLNHSSSIDGRAAETTRPAAIVVDPTAATWAELALLPGLVETIARRIVSYRESHALAAGGVPVYQTAADLTKVRGIGERQARRIAGQLRFPSTGSRDTS